VKTLPLSQVYKLFCLDGQKIRDALLVFLRVRIELLIKKNADILCVISLLEDFIQPAKLILS